jgi:hypothetical protein
MASPPRKEEIRVLRDHNRPVFETERGQCSKCCEPRIHPLCIRLTRGWKRL